MSNIKRLLSENDDLIQPNVALSIVNVRLQMEAAMYIYAIQKAVTCLESGMDSATVAEELKSSLTSQDLREIKKDLSAA